MHILERFFGASYRTTALGFGALLVVLAALAFTVPGCAEPTTKSPYSGEQVDRATLGREAEGEASRVAEEAETDAEAERDRLIRARENFDASVAQLEGETRQAVEALARQYEQTAAQVEQAVAAIARKAERGLALIQSKHAATAAVIERKEREQAWLAEAFGGLVGSPVVQGAVGTLPGGGLALGALGLLGGWLSRRAVHSAADRSWDEAKGEANAAALRTELAALKDSVRSLRSAPNPTGGTT